MKRNIISILAIISVLFLSGCSSTVLIKKSTNPQNVVLSSLRFHIDHFNQNAFYTGDYASLLVNINPRSLFNADLAQVYPLYSKQQNKMITSEVDSTYDAIRKGLKKMNFNLLPANALKGLTKYDPYGYPIDAKSNQAFKKANLALKVDVYIDQDFIDHFYDYPGSFHVMYTPRITMMMKMVNSKGKTVWSQQAVALAKSPVTIDDQIIGGFRNLTVTRRPELADIVNKAINSMLKKGKSKSGLTTTFG